MTGRTGSRATKGPGKVPPREKAAGAAGPRVRLSRPWVAALLLGLLLLILGGWQLFRLRPDPGSKGSVTAAPAPRTAAEPTPASGPQAAASVQPGPDGLPGERRLVQTGVTDGVQTEILAGLQEGDTVVVYPPETESRWRAEQAHQQSHRDRMMMRTVGGGAMRGPRR